MIAVVGLFWFAVLSGDQIVFMEFTTLDRCAVIQHAYARIPTLRVTTCMERSDSHAKHERGQ
ncbi:hypothetical protein [Caudoviricetes sp.]|nr:hypothetical protein [Caudoviricetes sp.]UOF79681.1 hypothetical protein [Caudoviricetes sp.]UOF79845.1 hypothetical protein [Bacteriophage sp.]UOF81352.1 hypothetical protein [Caudoviricetes sp.]